MKIVYFENKVRFYHSKPLLNVPLSKKVVKIFETYQSKSLF